MQFLAIVLMCIGFSILYGIVHDQVTARVCVEYFTIGHPPIFGTGDPTLLGIGWGTLATWWVGLLLGIPLALISRVGGWPKRDATSLFRPILGLMIVVGICALISGITGWVLASNGMVKLVGPISDLVPSEKHVAFLTDLWAHSASYFFGFVGGVVFIVMVFLSRRRMAFRPGQNVRP